ncbi:DUF790 family protein [soil metagenome]
MLRSEHVMARLQGGRLIPHRLSTENGQALDVARELCEVYAAHLNVSRSRLEEELTLREEELGPRLDARRGFKVVRALAKLLEERAEWASPTTSDPYTIRTRVFELAAALPEPPAAERGLLETTTREDIISQVSRETGVENLAALMYADRRGSQILSEFRGPSPAELLARYNVAQVQGILYSARRMVVDLGVEADARLVLHYVKFMDLIYDLESRSSGYRLRLDGPLSLFGGTRKYGLRLAKFLPGLLLTSSWKLSANVTWKGRDTFLELDSESGLKSHYIGPKELQDKEGDVREAFVAAWKRTKDTAGWKLEPGPGILPIPGLKNALVPDFTLRHADTGAEAHLEILGFWSERTLVDRVALIRAAENRGHRVLIAVSENLGATSKAISKAVYGAIVPFKNRIKVSAVVEKVGSNACSSRG